MKQAATFISAALIAIAASACCVLPAVLGVASAGTLGLGAALAPFRPYLMGLTILLLGTGFYFTYRPAKVACDADGRCSIPKPASRFGKAMLWAVTLFTVSTMAYPQFAAYRAEVKAASAQPVNRAVSASTTVVFAVSNMTCAECTFGLATALKKTSGVSAANVDFKTKRAIVRYDAARVGVPELRATIERSGFPARQVSS